MMLKLRGLKLELSRQNLLSLYDILMIFLVINYN